MQGVAMCKFFETRQARGVNWFTWAVLSLLPFMVLPSLAQPLPSLSQHPADLSWPTEAWPEAELQPETAAKLAPLIAAVMEREPGDVMGETRAIVIIHQGRLVAEAYRDGFGPQTKQVSWSMAKSMTQALIGRAVHEGWIESIDTAMPTPFSERDPRSQITWRQWLTMTDGLDYKEINATSLYDNDVVNMMYGRGKLDVLAYVDAELPILHPAGTHWNYSTAGFHLIGAALMDTLGVEQTLNAFEESEDWGAALERSPALLDVWPEEGAALSLPPQEDRISLRRQAHAQIVQRLLFQPLGMSAQPELDAAGTFLAGSLVYTSARDFAKFGYLYLRDGVWEDQRLLPEGWVDFARTKTPAENANVYGAGWWITPPPGEVHSHAQAATSAPYDAFHAGGHEGQTIWVVPSRDLVIVRLGLMPNSAENWRALYEWNQQIARAFEPLSSTGTESVTP